MAKSKKKSEDECPGCGKRADSVTTFAGGFYRATHGFKKALTRSSATGKMIECQVPERICTNIIATKPAPPMFEEEFLA